VCIDRAFILATGRKTTRTRPSIELYGSRMMDRLRQNRKTIQSKHLSRLYTRTPTLHRLIYGPRRGAITSGRVMPTVRSASRMRLFLGVFFAPRRGGGQALLPVRLHGAGGAALPTLTPALTLTLTLTLTLNLTLTRTGYTLESSTVCSSARCRCPGTPTGTPCASPSAPTSTPTSTRGARAAERL